MFNEFFFYNLKHQLLLFLSFLSLCNYTLIAQTNTIEINAKLDDKKDLLKIQQKVIYHNKSNVDLTTIFLHNWANSFKNNKTPLSKRLVDDYKKSFHFAKAKNKGYSKIHNLTINQKQVTILKKQPDIIQVFLNQVLKPKDSLILHTTYTVKIPNEKFTKYGKTKTGYHLRFWHITPAVYQRKWHLMSNLNMDDLYEDLADYAINIKIPKKYVLKSNLHQVRKKGITNTNYSLKGKKKKDIILHIDSLKKFITFKTKNKRIKTDLFLKTIPKDTTTKIIVKQIKFIENFLGKNPHQELLVDATTINKNSLHEIYGIPKWLNAFPKNFKWEISFFNALTKKYIEDILIQNKRTDYWLTNGLETFLMIKYIQKKYPNTTVLGKFSNYWPLKTYNIAKLKQNDKYSLVYQFSARKFYDQALTTPADSLSNFNRKIVSPYKAGLGLVYLQNFIGGDTLINSLKEFYSKNQLKLSNSNGFKEILTKNTSKDLQWFFNDYIKTSKKIDYKISEIKNKKDSDSLEITIKNKRDFSSPIAIYGIRDKKIQFKKWIDGTKSSKVVKIKKGYFDKIALNYENTYPEYNSLDNFRKINNTILNKPFQFRFFKDIENPYYNQLFYYPDFNYNLYDGLILGTNINNKSLVKHNFEWSLTPNFGTKSKKFTGSYSFNYNHFFKESSIYKIRYSFNGSSFNYRKNLKYTKFSPSITFQFKRKSLRKNGSKSLITRLISVNKETEIDKPKEESDKYNIFNIRYIHSKYDAIKSTRYAVNTEFNSSFSKITSDYRYREFFSEDKSFELRFFGGLFIHNNSKGDYFSFGLNRGSDYLFEQNLFGRSESQGLFSQQFVVDQAGFKSKFKKPYFSNQFISSINTSISIYKNIEFYNDFALLKNKNYSPNFFYANGIRLNFLPNIFEFYLPIYTNEGFEIGKESYASKIRFIISTNIDRIYNFLRRGLL